MKVDRTIYQRSDNRDAFRTHTTHEILKAVIFLKQIVYKWQILPPYSSPWKTFYYHYRMIRLLNKWSEINRF